MIAWIRRTQKKPQSIARWILIGAGLFLLAALVGCNLPVSSQTGAVLPGGVVFVTVGPSGLTTPTPLQPLPITPTPLQPLPLTPQPETPTQAPTETSLPTPTPTEALPTVVVPPTMATFTAPEDVFHVLLLGSDQRPGDYGFRTDSMLLVSVFGGKTEKVTLLSFPRDLYVYLPGWDMQRINTAMGYGGWDLLSSTFQYNFGIIPDRYVMVNFQSFMAIIDSLDGIEVQVAKTLTDHRDQYGEYTVEAGSVWMDGETALWYVRSRHSSSDFDRTRRQQEVLLALFNRLVSLDALARLPELHEQYKQSVTTNLTLGDMLGYLGLAAKVADDPSGRISRYAISGQHVYSYLVPDTNAQVLLPNWDAVREVLRQSQTP